jgi:TolB-like protein/Tfp pilus assembly protein PilF
MPTESASDLKFEIGHVLYIDIVAYSKLLIDEQRERIGELKEIVRGTEQVRLAETEGKLTRLPTGDGMALVFRNMLEAPLQCAVEISKALTAHPELRVRMGIHNGPVSEVADVNERANVAGAGINVAQRVMDCGEAGHILLSKHAAEDLSQYRQWQPYLHDLGECEVKHGAMLSVVNFYTDEIGNPQLPEKFKRGKYRLVKGILRSGAPRTVRSMWTVFWLAAVSILIAAFWIFSHRGQVRSTNAPAHPIVPKPVSEKSIAVLPFENLSGDPNNAYFTEGIQEEILTRLSKIADLKVISRTSTQHFKSSPDNLSQIAQRLGVTNILEGSVQKAANQVRVSVQLINATTDAHLWAESFDRELTDIFKVESDIAKNIADTLQATLTGSEKQAIAKHPTANPDAYELYLKGRFFWNKRTGADLRRAIDYFSQAIEKDPKYALAYSGLADCYASLGFGFDVGSLAPKETWPKAKAAALKALEMDDTLAEAHTSVAFTKLNYDWDWSGAEREFKRAIELNPNYDNAHHWYSHYFTAMGQTEESLAESKRALELDQLGLVMNVHLGWHYFYARQYDLAIEQFRKTLEMDPNYGLTHWYLGMGYEQKANYVEALTELQKGKDLLKENVGVEADLGHAYAVSGNRKEAQKVMDELEELSKQRYVSSYHIALIYTGLGEKDRAFEWLEKAYEERSDLLVYLKVEPRLDSLRSDPRFADLLRRMGL